MAEVHEKIVFRLIHTPCCGHLLCWVNPRLPRFCTECGSDMSLKIKESIMKVDEDAWLVLTKG